MEETFLSMTEFRQTTETLGFSSISSRNETNKSRPAIKQSHEHEFMFGFLQHLLLHYTDGFMFRVLLAATMCFQMQLTLYVDRYL